MMTIDIANLIGTPNAILQKFGLQVYEEVKKTTSNGQAVTLRFDDLSNATSGFFHASVGNLYRDLGARYNLLIFVQGLSDHPLWQEKYDDALALAKNPAKAREMDESISALFA